MISSDPLTPPRMGMARQLAFLALRQMDRQETFADVALDRVLRDPQISSLDRNLITELVYGVTRRARTLDALITRFGSKPASQQPPDLRRILQLGFYQLCFLTQIPASAAINTAVELARSQKLGQLTQVVNGILRTYLRQRGEGDPVDAELLNLSHEPAPIQLALLQSYPDWLVQLWWETLGASETAALCEWFNQPPAIDLRVNRWRVEVETVIAAFAQAGLAVLPMPEVPGSLRLQTHSGDITQLPGFEAGWWTVQDSSAQQVVQLLDPQPGETIIDCCAAPGGKSTHIGEVMQNQGQVWALDRHAGRLKRVESNAKRLGLTCIEARAVDLTDPNLSDLPVWESADRVLLDAPCSGLGTLHRHADARWRQSPERIQELVLLQSQLLHQAARWVKPGGILVYSTCTLHPQENQQQIEQFLAGSDQWTMTTDPVQIWPHHHHRDGFFMARLRKSATKPEH